MYKLAWIRMKACITAHVEEDDDISGVVAT
jgi:hypothetical protein